MASKNYKTIRMACYTAYFTMSSVFSLPPVLFVTLRNMYGISYTLLGTLVLANFCTQLTIDLIFTLFSKHFNVHKAVTVMPCITAAGLMIFALVPTFFPEFAYAGLLTGTIIFSVAAGLSEVLLSPIIAAIPSETPQRDMSTLHSLYAFGVFTVVVISTLFLKFVGHEYWMYLTLFMALWPLISAVLFARSKLPDMSGNGEANQVGEKPKRHRLGLALCVACIFFGSCAECAMSSWISGFMENALHIPKAVGDILGMAMFAILLGIGRISYARYGKNIMRILLIGMCGAAVCYLLVGLSGNVIVGFVACIFTGLFTSMLWPGSLIMMEENIPGAGVAAFALMASGGDLGASVAPQLMGVVIDKVSVSGFGLRIAESLGLTAEQVGMKAGMLVCAIFPAVGAILLMFIMRYFSKRKNAGEQKVGL